MRTLASIVLAVAAPLFAGAATPDAVTHIPAETVASAFAKGAPLVEVPGYKIHASRRVEPGQAEIHVLDTDVIHVLEGTATFVTGGEVVEPKTVAPDEIRGGSIRGGRMRSLRPGDVVVVPSGVPHQFVAVEGPFLYYVVKVEGGGTR